MKVGILLTGNIPETLRGKHPEYDRMFVRLLAGRGFTFQTYDVAGGVFPASTSDAEAWLITGSQCGVYEDHTWIPPLEDFIRTARNDCVRMIGVCFGHQIIAQAMGGRVVLFDGGRMIGPGDYDFLSPDERLRAMAFHQDQVIGMPQHARLLASSEDCAIAGLAYEDDAGKPWAMTVQPHPEFDAAYVLDLMDLYRDTLPAERVAAARARIHDRLSTSALADRMSLFMQSVRSF